MSYVPRLAIGTVQPQADFQPMAWAIMDAFERAEVQVQSFLSQSCLTLHDGCRTITGQPHRHLDSWLMSPEVCRGLFARGSRDGELSLVFGRFDDHLGTNGSCCVGGRLDPLCDWLDLPRVTILDVSDLTGCDLPKRPADVDAVLVDGAANTRQARIWQQVIEVLWRVPVLGHLPENAGLRELIDRLPCGSQPSRDLCRALGDSLLPNLRCEPLLQLAHRKSWFDEPSECLPAKGGRRQLRIALAMDQAFDRHFPDVIDAFEARGAKVNDFSPLRDAALPTGTDVVFLGGGIPENYLAELSANHCLRQALHQHVKCGGRVYAEDAGLAFLSNFVEAHGTCYSMCGLVDVRASRVEAKPQTEAIEFAAQDDSWLCRQSSILQGYRSSQWQFQSFDALCHPAVNKVGGSQANVDFVVNGHVVGCSASMNFAARPDLLDHFFAPLGVESLESASFSPW